MLALHISHPYLDLKPVTVGGACAVGWQAWAVEDEGDQAGYFNKSNRFYAQPLRHVLLTRRLQEGLSSEKSETSLRAAPLSRLPLSPAFDDCIEARL